MADLVHACPVCGNELLHTCYHEGEDIPAVDMDAEKAAALRREALACQLEAVPITDEMIARARDVLVDRGHQPTQADIVAALEAALTLPEDS
jgi:hypothetical protein